MSSVATEVTEPVKGDLTPEESDLLDQSTKKEKMDVESLFPSVVFETPEEEMGKAEVRIKENQPKWRATPEIFSTAIGEVLRIKRFLTVTFARV